MRSCFELSFADRKRIRKAAFPDIPVGYSGAMTVLYGTQFTISLAEHRHSVWTVIPLVACVAMAVVFALQMRAKRMRRVAAKGRLEITADGVRGTVDDLPYSLGWADIAGARDLPDAIVLLQRGNAAAIALPKATLDDPGALWALLYDRLVPKRGLIRPTLPRTSITSSIA